MTSILERLLAANQRYASCFESGELPAPPRLRTAVVTCMDARIVPHRLLGLAEGDAHVIRNAGGRASDDALRSLMISTRLLGTREIVIIQHTDCGMMGLDEEGVRQDLRQETGVDTSALELLAFGELDESVRRDVATVRSFPLLARGVTVYGCVYEVESGRLRQVK